MRKENDCEYSQQVRNLALKGGGNKELEQHIANCPECTKFIKVLGWMQAFAIQTPGPQSLPSPGFLLFKARLLEKQAAARWAVRPMIWMKFAAPAIVILAVVYLQTLGGFSVASMIGKTLSAFGSIAPLAILAVVGAGLLCVAAAYLMRDSKTDKRKLPPTGFFRVL